jgi:hypothetical protein
MSIRVKVRCGESYPLVENDEKPVRHERDDIADYFEVRDRRLIALLVYRVSYSKMGSIKLRSIGLHEMRIAPCGNVVDAVNVGDVFARWLHSTIKCSLPLNLIVPASGVSFIDPGGARGMSKKGSFGSECRYMSS